MRTADYIFKYLADIGVRDCFMVSGGGAMFLNDALGKEKRIRPVCTHHEQGAAIAADGYSRVSGKLAVVSVTTGPGGTNTLTGVIGEWLDSIPVLFLSGQVKFSTCLASCPELPLRQLGDQEINIIDIVRPVTKYAKMVTNPSDIAMELEKAVFIANSGRKGPVWLDIPINVQSAEIDPEKLSHHVPETGENEIPTDEAKETARKLLSSKSPVLIAGSGIRQANAIPDFERLVELLKIPVLGTFGGFDLLPTDSPFSAGRIGSIGTRSGNIALQNADFVLCIGSRNNIRQVSYNYENFAKNAMSFICVDIDEAELKKPTVHPTMNVHADAGKFLRELLLELESVRIPDFSVWRNWTLERKDRYDTVLPEYYHVQKGVNPYVFTRILTRILPEESVVACTNATPSLALFQAGIIKRNQRMFCNSGCAAMGFGLPAAMGSAAAFRGKGAIVCLEGDGSFMMNMQELQTVRHHRFPIKLFLYNNNEYCSIRQTQDNFFKRHTGCDGTSGVTFPDWKILASAFGWPYYEIDSAEKAEKLIPEILAAKECAFCNVILTPGYNFAPKLSARKLADGSLVSPSLEDMSPFLPEKEMKNNIFAGK